MLSVRRIASGSVHLWKREMRSGRIMAPFSSDAEHQNNREVKVPTFTTGNKAKSCIFEKLQSLISETLDYIIMEGEKTVNKEDLVEWAKQLDKEGKKQYALEIFEWMDKKKMDISPWELAYFVDLIARTKDLVAAKKYFDELEPDFDPRNANAKNMPAWDVILKRMDEFDHYGHILMD